MQKNTLSFQSKNGAVTLEGKDLGRISLIDRFRADIHKARMPKGDDRYVTYRDAKGNVSFGKIINVERGDRVSVQSESGDIVTLEGRDMWFGKMIKSISSKDFFENRFENRSVGLEMTGDPRVDRFRRALNNNKVPEGDDRYVAYTDASGKQMVGEITDVQKNTLSFQSKNGVVTLEAKDLRRISPIDRFRVDISKGRMPKGDDRYITYRDAKGYGVLGKIIDVEGDNRVSVQSQSGDIVTIEGNDIWGMRKSISPISSKDWFETNLAVIERRRLGETSLSKKLNVQQVEALGKARIFRRKLEATGNPELDRFRAALNNNKVPEGAGKYIENQSGEIGKITNVQGNRVSVQIQNGDNVTFSLREIGKMNPSENAKWYFQSLDQFHEGLKNKKLPEGDGIYISYKEFKGNRSLGKILELEEGIVIQRKNGTRFHLNRDRGEVYTIRPSKESKDYFLNNRGEMP